MIGVVISGGQTGVDRAALDVATELGILTAGWCPKGRRCARGKIPLRYRLTETDDASYPVRTVANIDAACATLILVGDEATPGTTLTIRECIVSGSRYRALKLSDSLRHVSAVEKWINGVGEFLGEDPIRILNVAGPSERRIKGSYVKAQRFLKKLFLRCGVRR